MEVKMHGLKENGMLSYETVLRLIAYVGHMIVMEQ